jgi:nicotinate-nucleotide pyrophosphorylase (carboxylating)
VAAALERVQKAYRRDNVSIQIEVDDMTQLFEALAHGADAILLDNFNDEELADAVAFVRRTRSDVVLEASGGLSFKRAGSVAATGVDYISVGALTHSAPTLDIGLDT